MQEPLFFDEEIIKKQNLEFMRDSNNKNIKDNFSVLFNGIGGVASGYTLGGSGTSSLTISAGIAYDNNSERLQMYSGISIVPISGTNTVFATLATSNFDPNPSSSTYNQSQININPINGSGVSTSLYNTVNINQVSGVGSIALGLITVSGVTITNINVNPPNRQDLVLASLLDLSSLSVSGSIIANGTLDSTKFTNPLTANINLGSNVNILPTVSGSSSLGTKSIPFLELDVKNLNVTNISGLSPINVQANLNIAPGNSIVYQGSDINGLKLNDLSGKNVSIIGGGSLFVDKINSNSGPLTINAEFGKIFTSFFPGANSFLVSAGGIGGSNGSEAAVISGGSIGLYGTSNINIVSNNLLLTGPTTISGSTTFSNGLTVLQNGANVNGLSTFTGGISSNQSQNNLIQNSEFANASGVSSFPQVWQYVQTSSGTNFALQNYANDPTVLSSGISNTFLNATISGLNGIGDLLYIPFNGQPNQDYYLSFNYLASGTNFSNINIKSYITEGVVNPSGISASSNVINFPIVSGTWQRYNGQISTNTGTTNPFNLVISPYIFSGPSLANLFMKVTNVKLTKGKGDAKFSNTNSKASWQLKGNSNITQINAGTQSNVSIPGIGTVSVFSEGQFCMVNFAATWGWNITGNPGDTPTLGYDIFIDGISQAPQAGLWANGNGGTVIHNIPISTSWSGYLSPGFHTVQPIITTLTLVQNAGNTSTISRVVTSVLLI